MQKYEVYLMQYHPFRFPDFFSFSLSFGIPLFLRFFFFVFQAIVNRRSLNLRLFAEISSGVTKKTSFLMRDIIPRHCLFPASPIHLQSKPAATSLPPRVFVYYPRNSMRFFSSLSDSSDEPLLTSPLALEEYRVCPHVE